MNGTDASDNDGSARQLVVTYNDRDEKIGENEKNSEFQVITNFILQPGYYADSAPEEKKGLDRYEQLWADVNAAQGIFRDEEEAMELKKTVGCRSWNNDDKNSCTVHSVIYNLTDCSAFWVPNENFDHSGYRFDFS